MNSRALHEELGIKSKHADWIARKIASLDLEEGEDYTVEEAGGRKYHALSPEAVAWIRASTSKEELKEMASTNVKTKAILKDLEHVELQVPEGFEIAGEDIAVTSLHLAEMLQIPHKAVLRSIRSELEKLRTAQNCAVLPQDAITSVVSGVVEGFYINTQNKRQPLYYLNEHASIVILAKFSAEFRATLSYKFLQYRSALVKYLQAETVAKHIPQRPLSRRYVYIIENIDTENFKVGITTDVARRLATFQTGCDGELSVYYESLVCSNAKNIEAEIHNHFREYKIREGVGREWFSNKLDKLEIIDYLKEQNYVLESSFGEEYEIL